MNKIWKWFEDVYDVVVYSHQYEKLFIVFLLLVSYFPRFAGLGYSHFYGDETKILYLDKTIPAITFFLNQRKGPFQFLVAWFMETVTNSYDEFWIRLPFAIAGLLSVLVFYFLIREFFTFKIAALASLMYSFSGFSIAFSRTAQYQSFLALFGLFGFYLFVRFVKTKNAGLLFFSSLSYFLAFLCHYDAVFFLVPVVFLIEKHYFAAFIKFFIIPLLLSSSVFYVPYLVKGYFFVNTVGYLSRRVTGSVDSLQNNSLYTFLVYNPFVYYLILLIIGTIFSARVMSKDHHVRKLNLVPFLVWFTLPFLIFTLFIKSPGTHILNYFLPLYVSAAVGISDVFAYIKKDYSRYFAFVLIAFVLVYQIFVSYFIFIPNINFGYPWKSESFLFYQLPKIEKRYQLFLYGYNYYRNWEQISVSLKKLGARGFYTNDNKVMSMYYVRDIPFTEPASNFWPQYYVYVPHSQEFKSPTPDFLSHYTEVERIALDSYPDVVIYKNTDLMK